MNWQLLRASEEVVVEAGEPLCMLFLQRRGELQSFDAEVVDLARDPEVARSYAAWSSSRASFLDELLVDASPAKRQGWQKDYFQGRSSQGERSTAHQTRLHLRPFRDQAHRP